MSFYSSLATYYDLLFPFDQGQYRFLEAVIDPACGECPGVRTGEEPLGGHAFLDVGCGTGTLLSALSDRFNKVVGVDSNQSLLALAAEKMLPGEGKKAEFLCEDMTEIEEILAEDEFNLITCMGNTVAHLTKPLEMQKFFSSLYNLLENNGVFVFQTINYDRVLRDGLRGLPSIVKDDVSFERYYSLPGPDGTITFDAILTDAERDLEFRNSLALFPVTKTQLEAFLKGAGFGRWTFYGDWSGAPWTQDSFMTIGVCL